MLVLIFTDLMLRSSIYITKFIITDINIYRKYNGNSSLYIAPCPSPFYFRNFRILIGIPGRPPVV